MLLIKFIINLNIVEEVHNCIVAMDFTRLRVSLASFPGSFFGKEIRYEATCVDWWYISYLWCDTSYEVHVQISW